MNRNHRDAAHATAVSILACLENCLRPEEMRDAYEEIYRRVLAGIEAMEIMQSREERRLKPSVN